MLLALGLRAARAGGPRAAAPLAALHPARFFAANASVAPALVKELRTRTGASMGKCREALLQEEGDVSRAVEWLRKRGIQSAERRTSETPEGLLGIAVAPQAAAIVELRADTDFLTRGELFQRLTLAVAAAAAQRSEPVADVRIEDVEGLAPVAAGVTVSQALLELTSVVGERLALGRAERLEAGPGAVVAGYAHPRHAGAAPGTGRLAAIVGVRGTPGPAGLPGDADERLRAVGQQLARHVVAAQPRFLDVASVPEEVLERERGILEAAFAAERAEKSGSKGAAKVDDAVLKKVLDGKMQKYYKDCVLLRQDMLLPTTNDGQEVNMPVSRWLSSEAEAGGFGSIEVDDFRFAQL